MALFSKGALTQKGKALIAKAEAAHCGIALTKAQTGAGVHEDTSVGALEQATALISPKREFPFSSVVPVAGSNGVVKISLTIHNRGQSELYILNELGIFANDPDEGEILYCILVSEDNIIYIPADNNVGISTISETVYLEVANASSVTINTTGAVVSAAEFTTVKSVLFDTSGGTEECRLGGGRNGQMLTKWSELENDFGWGERPVFTGKRNDFPVEGAKDSVYIDIDTSSVYIWTKLENEEMGYFKLPLGSEASETLQAQITANRNNIAALALRTTALENKFNEVVVSVAADGWESSEEDGIPVYTQSVSVTGMTELKNFDVFPAPQNTGAALLEAEQKAIGVFFAHGTCDGGDGIVTLSCRKKRPATTFGIKIRGDLT